MAVLEFAHCDIKAGKWASKQICEQLFHKRVEVF